MFILIQKCLSNTLKIIIQENFRISILFLWCYIHPSITPLCPQDNGTSLSQEEQRWGRLWCITSILKSSPGELQCLWWWRSLPVHTWIFLSRFLCAFLPWPASFTLVSVTCLEGAPEPSPAPRKMSCSDFSNLSHPWPLQGVQLRPGNGSVTTRSLLVQAGIISDPGNPRQVLSPALAPQCNAVAF